MPFYIQANIELTTLCSNPIDKMTIQFISQTRTLLRMKGGTINNYYRTSGINCFLCLFFKCIVICLITNEFVIVKVCTGLPLYMFKPRKLPKHCTHMPYSAQWIASWSTVFSGFLINDSTYTFPWGHSI